MLTLSSLFKCFPFVALVVAVFLLGFLLIGGASTDTAYSSVFLIKAAFNQTLPVLAETLNYSAPAITIKANYMALCVCTSNQLICSATKNLTALQQATTITNGAVSISLVDVATAMLEVCKPYLLVTSIVMVLLLLLFVIWTGLPFVPGKLVASKVALCLEGLTVLLWGLGAMLQAQGVESASEFISVASLGLVVVLRGGRAHAMAWSAFLFIFASFICLGFGVAREYYLARSTQKM